MNTVVRAQALRWLAQGRAAQWVEVVATRGSAPREAGTRMLVAADAVAGTIGGGHLELQAIGLARSRLSRGETAPQEQALALGPSLGQCCGGAVTLRYRALDEATLIDWPEPAPRFVLQLYGAGHVGRAVVRLLEGIDCRVQWIDEREDEFPPHDELAAPHIERICVDAVEAEVAAAPAGACFLVMTHQHDLDLRITEAVLERGGFRWLGLIGSQTKRARFVHHFERRGIPAAAIERLVCPIGVPGIEGKEPEVIAVAVVAQLLQACPETAP